MEHRLVPRHPVSVKAIVYKDGLPLAVARLRNVSRQGLFIASDYDNVAPDHVLEIEIHHGVADRKSRRRCRAVVVHKCGGGIGLAVDDGDASSCELLEDVLVSCLPRRALGR
jgi:hypothetical protein